MAPHEMGNAYTATSPVVGPHQRAHSVMAVPSELEQHRFNKYHSNSTHYQHQSAASNVIWHQEIYKQYGYEPKHKNPSYFGPYLLLQTLGEGEFAKVKAGVHVHTNQEVAIKLMRKDHIKHASLETKLEREISVLKSVYHPYIVKLFEVLTIKNYIGIVLQRAAGGELFDYILKHHFLQEIEAKRLFAQLISGVHYMHQKHIVHRDLKLENLLLSKDRDIIITDFGFANRFQIANKDLMATSCGSPCYAAPELVINDENTNYVGTAADIWSCGVILFAMLCGYLPFDDDPTNPQGASINVLYKYIVSTPLEIPKTLSIDATHLLRRMLVPDPKKRCTMDEIRRHPWLSDHQELLNQTMEELESHMGNNYSDLHPVHQVRQTHDYTMLAPPLAAPTLLENTEIEAPSERDQNYRASVCTTMPTAEEEEEDDDDNCIPEHEEQIFTETEKTSVSTPDKFSPSIVSPIIEPTHDVDEKVSPIGSINSKSNKSSTPRPTSFLQTKFFSTLQRHVSTNSSNPTELQSKTSLDNKIPSRSQSVQPQNARRNRTTSEYYTNSSSNNNPRKSLHVLPSVSEQTTVTDESNTIKTRSKGQKLIDWFKRKPSSQSTRLCDFNKTAYNVPTKQQRCPLPTRPISALPNPIRAMPIGKPFGSYAADFNDNKLRLHRGAVDQDALTSRAPNEVLLTIKSSLTMMGIDMKRCHDYKIKCVRPARQHKQTQQQQPRPRNNKPAFKLFFPVNTKTATAIAAAKNSHAQNVIYGEQGIDPGDEIQFSVELSKIENLPGLYVVDIKRTRGNIWAFKFLYHTLLDLLDLSGHSGMGYMAQRRISNAEEQQFHQQKNRASYMTTSSSGSSMMIFDDSTLHK